MKILPCLFSLTFLSLLIGCQPAVPVAKQPAVSHVVLCWLKEPGNEGQRLQLMDRSLGFSSIPGVLDVKAGTALDSDRPVVDDSFDVAVIIDFESLEALHAYESHPLHKKAVEELLKPLTSRVLIYDVNLKP